MKALVCIPILLFFFSGLHAQEEDWRLFRSTKVTSQVEDSARVPEQPMRIVNLDVPVRDPGEIRYIQEERIGILDEYLKSHPIQHDGYRIQLIFGSRNEVANARSKFLASWDIPAYETYLPPNFRLRVGDFMTRFQAEKALRDLKSKFPNAYLVRDKIEVPKIYQ